MRYLSCCTTNATLHKVDDCKNAMINKSVSRLDFTLEKLNNPDTYNDC
jgi:hypothetical protein